MWSNIASQQRPNSDTNVGMPTVRAVLSFSNIPTAPIYRQCGSKTDMAMNGSGIRDTARVLQISPTRVIEQTGTADDLLFQDRTDARYGDWLVHQSL
jgi:hypothetical protein